MIKCPSCAREQEPRLLCAECGSPMGLALDLFAALGLPRKLTLDASRLEQVYHDLGRRIHPDRFANGAASLRDASLRGTALLTRAYRTLRDPVSRGLYWLELNGHKLAENNKNVPADLAAMVFEVQEQLDDLRNARGGNSGKAERLRVEVDERRIELHRMIEQAQNELAQNFARWDARSAADAYVNQTDRDATLDALVMELKAILSKIAYLRTLIRDIDRELDSAQAA
jgi:molecular chaperone HscB